MTLIRLINHDGNPEYVTVEDVRRIWYSTPYERVVVRFAEGGEFHAPADMSVDEMKQIIDAGGDSGASV